MELISIRCYFTPKMINHGNTTLLFSQNCLHFCHLTKQKGCLGSRHDKRELKKKTSQNAEKVLSVQTPAQLYHSSLEK